MTFDTLLSPFALNDITLRNRVVMAPMTTWAANDDLTTSDAEDAWYRHRVGSVGLVLTACSHVAPEGIGFTCEVASTDDAHIPSLRRLADAAKSGGARAILQLVHAGNKALPDLAPEVVSASAVPVAASTFAPAQTPRALTEPEILGVIASFGQATRRALLAGFDGIELHGAHGFLLQNFFSPTSNTRDDMWGGSRENRMRFALAVVAEVQRVIAAHADRPFLVGYRVSPEERGGYGIDDSLFLTDALIDAGVDYIHASLGNVLTDRPHDGDQTLIAQRIVLAVGGRIPVIAAGGLRTPEQAEQALHLGISLAAIGQGLVMNPDWVERTMAGDSEGIETELDTKGSDDLRIPKKTMAGILSAEGWFRLKSA